MTYNTGNAVPSRDPRDLLDNAESFDIRATSREVRSTPDRLGAPRKTWYGMEQDFAEFLAASGFEPVHLAYQDGVALQVDRPTQLIDRSGSVYRVKMPASFPVALSGTWEADAALLVDVGDAALRAEIGDAVVRYESVVALLSSPVAQVKTERAIYVSGYYAPGDGGAGTWLIDSSALCHSAFAIELPDGRFANLMDRVVSPLQIGYSLNADNMSSATAVDSNWAKMKAFLLGLQAESWRTMVSLRPKMTLRDVCAEWLARRPCPIGFYSDSTTDGATTTGHTPSTGSDSPFAVTINESPNAYPAKVEEYLKLIIGADKPVRCYNGGFDSESFKNGFGLKHWYNTWFRGTSGSNVDWSDVQMIVVGFGTIDSINQGDPGSVLDAYAIDIECTIIDCLLRGVTPVLQGPVLTTQKAGSTVNYRNGDESITLIETMQLRLCQKYGLEHISYRDEVERMLSGYTGMNYLDYMSPDMVHPNDMGHRIHAGYLVSKIFPNLARIKPGSDVEHIFAGHNAYIPTFNEVISPASRGGLILKTMGVYSDESYFYSWTEADGNAKDANALLLRLPVYVERPTSLYVNDGSSTPPANRVASIRSCTLGVTAAATLTADTYPRPARTYNSRAFVARLPYGLSIVNINAGGVGGNYQFLSAYLVDGDKDPMKLIGRRPQGSAEYLTRMEQRGDTPATYLLNTMRTRVAPTAFYNPSDTTPVIISFELAGNLNAASTYKLMTHNQDLTAKRDCYNFVQISGDTVEFGVCAGGAETILHTTTAAGLNALLVEGARVQLRYTSGFIPSVGVKVELLVNGAVQASYTAAIGAMWFDGAGFECTSIPRRNETIFSTRVLPSFAGADSRFLM